jgi:hypothetical protein
MLKACAGVAVAMLLSGCDVESMEKRETRHETRSVELDQSASARVQIRMGAGELLVASGTPKLLEADFAYNIPGWRPVVEYRAGANGGDLTISQPEDAGMAWGGSVYNWKLNLNAELPLEIDADMGAGEATLQLGRMNLRRVNVDVGVGEVKVDLRGEPKHSYGLQVHGGVGAATIYLPKDVAIAATAAGGIGSIDTTGLEKRDGVWINPDRLGGPVTVSVDVKGGVGEIRLIR